MAVAGSWARLRPPHPDASEVWRDGGEAGPADPTREAAQLLLKEGQKFLEVEHKELLVTVPAGCSEGQKFCMQSPHGGSSTSPCERASPRASRCACGCRHSGR